MQPESRQQSGNRKLARVVDTGEQRESLRKGSINGFFNIIISLVWWYASIKNASQSKVYKEVVEDVAWVLDWMLDQRKEGKKRASGSAEGADNGKGKR